MGKFCSQLQALLSCMSGLAQSSKIIPGDLKMKERSYY